MAASDGIPPLPRFNKVTVPETKAEPEGRGVPFPSKLKKQELFGLPTANWLLPVDPEKKKAKLKQPRQSKSKQAESKLKHWKADQPVRKLLCFEFEEGNVPLDPNEVGPAEIHCNHMETPEFEGVELDDHFTECLKSLRQHTVKEEPLLKWNEFHPARDLLFNEMKAGNAPTDKKKMGPEEAWSKHCDTKELKTRGMKFGETSKRRPAALRKVVGKDRSRAEDDSQQLVTALKQFPPPTHNHRGEPQWNGSKAQELLKQDTADGEHEGKKPMELWATGPECEPHKKTFKNKMCQAVKTNKCLHTLEFDAEQKLRKNPKKMSLEDWGCGTPVEQKKP